MPLPVVATSDTGDCDGAPESNGFTIPTWAWIWIAWKTMATTKARLKRGIRLTSNRTLPVGLIYWQSPRFIHLFLPRMFITIVQRVRILERKMRKVLFQVACIFFVRITSAFL